LLQGSIVNSCVVESDNANRSIQAAPLEFPEAAICR